MKILLQINEDNGTTTKIETEFDFVPRLGDHILLKNRDTMVVSLISHLEGDDHKFNSNITLNPLPK